eukprot:m.32639 g.32639  ORF g.32639 m.32639 type:complete len:290 (-) comp5558_c0_seq2:2695-3564(-)
MESVLLRHTATILRAFRASPLTLACLWTRRTTYASAACTAAPASLWSDTVLALLIGTKQQIGRIEDVHFNPWFSNTPEFMKHQTTFGRSFVFGRSDWEYVFNTFSFGYAIGYHFIETPTGSMNGNFLGLGADLAVNASVQVDASQPAGILITNGEFTSFHSPGFDPNATSFSTQVVVGAHNTGPVQFVNTAFWGPTNNIARLYGQGVTTFSSCNFVQWDLQAKNGSAAIHALAGSVIVQGSVFQGKGTQLVLEAAVTKAVVVGNVITGPLAIETKSSKTNVQVGYNAHD